MRPFYLEDLPAVLAILEEAKASLKRRGIPQWQDGYPNEETLRKDFAEQNGYVLEENGKIIGYSALIFGEDPSYQQIKGAWKTTGTPYATCHRLMMTRDKSHGASGVFLRDLINFAEGKKAQSLRVDTHEKNQPMRHLLARNGFEECGEIILVTTLESRLGLERKISFS